MSGGVRWCEDGGQDKKSSPGRKTRARVGPSGYLARREKHEKPLFSCSVVCTVEHSADRVALDAALGDRPMALPVGFIA
jgi:hypothetical protein